jgi:hypothetical protein
MFLVVFTHFLLCPLVTAMVRAVRNFLLALDGCPGSTLTPSVGGLAAAHLHVNTAQCRRNTRILASRSYDMLAIHQP